MLKTMLKKIEQYYTNVFKKFGWIVPAAVVGGCFVLAIVVESCNLINSWLKAGKGGEVSFTVVFVIGCLALVAGIVYAAINLKKTEVNVIDVVLACAAALSFLMMIMYLFTLGQGQFLGKWIVTAIVLVASLVLTYFRVQKVK